LINIIYLFSGALILSLGYGICYYSCVRRNRPGKPKHAVEPKQKTRFNRPSMSDQLADSGSFVADESKIRRPGKKERE
jgi:hypothetical protein